MHVGRRSFVLGPRALLGFVCLPLFLTAMQYHMVTVGLADMISDLDAPLQWVSWVLVATTISSAAVQPVAGRLGELYGAGRVFAASLLVFTVASLACALAPNIGVLIAARLVQGAGSGAIMPTAFGLIATAFPLRRAQALGLVSSLVPIGTLVGPNLGGFVVENFGWRGTFALNVPIGLALGLAALVLLPTGERRPGVSVDGRGSLLLAGAIFALVYCLTELSADQQNWLVIGTAAVCCTAACVALVVHERHAEAPVIDVDLFRERAFVVTNALHFLYGVALLGVFGFVPLYVQTAYGMSPSESGLLLTPRAIAMAGISVVSAMLLPRTGYRVPITLGMLFLGGSTLLLSLSLHDPTVLGVPLDDFTWLAIVIGLTGVAYGLAGPALNNVALELAPDRVASVSGLRGTFRAIGGATGTAVIVLVVSRAETTEAGLELAFKGIAVVTLLSLVVIRMVPEPERIGWRRTTPSARDRVLADEGARR